MKIDSLETMVVDDTEGGHAATVSLIRPVNRSDHNTHALPKEETCRHLQTTEVH